MNESNEIPTEPSLERRSRRRFSAADKQRLLTGLRDRAIPEIKALFRLSNDSDCSQDES